MMLVILESRLASSSLLVRLNILVTFHLGLGVSHKLLGLVIDKNHKFCTLVLDLYGWQNVSIAIEAKFLAAHGPFDAAGVVVN